MEEERSIVKSSVDEHVPGAVEVAVYRSTRRAETYLYLRAEGEFEELPEALLDHFGTGDAFLQFWLHENKKLAQAEPKKVLAALAEQGFYLQLPPDKDIVPSG
jgi:uncharacterized protein